MATKQSDSKGRNAVDRQTLDLLSLTDREILARSNASSTASYHVYFTASSRLWQSDVPGTRHSCSYIHVKAVRGASESTNGNCCHILAGEGLHASLMSLRYGELVDLSRGMDVFVDLTHKPTLQYIISGRGHGTRTRQGANTASHHDLILEDFGRREAVMIAMGHSRRRRCVLPRPVDLKLF